MTELVDDFARLFEGRDDAVGTNEGGSLPLHDRDVAGRVRKHLERGGGYAIGIYPMVEAPATPAQPEPEWWVHWGCVDWDEGYERSWPDAINTHNILGALGITSWIERSRSKGWHLWVFSRTWVPAQTMRYALIAACELVDAPIKEVNPKQVVLSPGGLGNYVRLPYPGGYEAHDRGQQCVVDPTTTPPSNYWAEDFVKRALENRTPTLLLEELAARYTPPETHDPGQHNTTPATTLDPMLSRKLKPLTFLVVRDGPLPDEFTGVIDRSAGLFKLARQLWEDGNVSYDQAWEVMCQADRTWGKYLVEGRPDVLSQTLRKAWSQT